MPGNKSVTGFIFGYRELRNLSYSEEMRSLSLDQIRRCESKNRTVPILANQKHSLRIHLLGLGLYNLALESYINFLNVLILNYFLQFLCSKLF